MSRIRTSFSMSALALAWVACRHAAPPAPERPIAPSERFTCCNLHYESDEITDANYWVGKKLAAGTPVRLESMREESVTFSAGELRLTLKHKLGGKEETLQQYVDKVFVVDDPKPRIAAYPLPVRRAIDNGKVERGMTREQTILSLGYPPTDRTPSTDEPEWTYWWNRWDTYKVVFDGKKVADVIGRPAPTAEMAIPKAEAPPKPAKRKKK